MMGGKQIIRPQTAATTTKKDEDRIKKQMKYFEMLESKIDADLEKINQQKDDEVKKRPEKKGIHITKKMLLDASQCDELHEIQAVSQFNLNNISKVVLRDMNIEYFDDNKTDRLKIEDLVNIEAILASHNIIRDLYGIGQLTSLKELNLSYNNISDIR